MRFAPLLLVLGCGSATSADPVETSPIDTTPVLSEASVVEVRMILIAWAGAQDAPAAVERSEQDAQERADTIIGLASEGEMNFGQLCREYSDGTFAPLRFSRGEGVLPPNAEEVAFSTAIGRIAGPVRTPRGYMILRRRPDPSD